MRRWNWQHSTPAPKEGTLKRRAKDAGIPESTVRSRMERAGMTLEEALAAKPGRGGNRRPAPRRGVDGGARGGEYSPHQMFVDYLRMAMGLDPIYRDPKTDAELEAEEFERRWGVPA